LRATAPRLRLAGMHAEVARGWSMRLRGFEVGGFESVKRKSYSHSHVMAHATASQRELGERLIPLSDMVGRRLRAANRRGSIVSVGVVYRPDPGHFSKQAKQPEPVATGDEIYQAALKLLTARDPRLTVGTLGVGGSSPSAAEAGQLDLIAARLRPRGGRLAAAADAIP